jgi:hypothetical protein
MNIFKKLFIKLFGCKHKWKAAGLEGRTIIGTNIYKCVKCGKVAIDIENMPKPY